MPASAPERPETAKRLGEILVEDDVITTETLMEALRIQQASLGRRRLGTVLIEMGKVSEEEITFALGRRLHVPFVDLDSKVIDRQARETITVEDAARLRAVPFEFSADGELRVAMADPTDVVGLDDIRIVTGLRVQAAVALPSALDRAVTRLGAGDMSQGAARAPEASAEQLLDMVLAEAARRRASDLHIEPKADRVMMRIRVDGHLRPLFHADSDIHPALVSRVKIISELDIAERRRPQDGRAHLKLRDRILDARVSVMPSAYGEKVVLRLVDRSESIPTLAATGLGGTPLEMLRAAVTGRQGLVLISGPTGSGKTTTLYAALEEVASPELNLVTLEDPIERDLSAATQVQIDEKIGFTFPAALRAVLRQDPDVVMVGEVRDNETASIALRAALTGHIVLSTIHTNDAPATLTRLVDMGMEPYMVGSAVTLVAAQRLVRRVCDSCAEAVAVPVDVAAELGIDLPGDADWRAGRGCPACGETGFRGRMGLYEVLPVSDAIRDMLGRGVSDTDVARIAYAEGFSSLWDAGIQAASLGRTTMHEVARILRGIRMPLRA